MEEQLTEKQEKYCQAYLICGNQSAAYRIAFDAEDSNVNTVAVEACRLHANPNVTLRIDELRKEAYERNKMTVDEVLHGMAEMARFDIADLYDENGVLLPLHKMPKTARQMIEGIDVDELYVTIDGKREIVGQTKKVRLARRSDAIERFMKHFGQYKENNQQKQPVNNIVINLGDGIPENET